MDGSVAGHDAATGRFTHGHSEYRAKQKRLAARVARLRRQYDDSPLLAAIARHLDEAERGRNALTRTRAANAAARLLKQVPRKSAQQQLPATLEDYLNE
jgi:hypothetical protein